MKRFAAIFLAFTLFANAGPTRAAELEPARDAIRRHEYERAAALLGPFAAAGDAEASFLLSQLSRYGRGVARDLPQACRLLESAATTGHARAAGSLAAMLESGECTASARKPEEWRAAARAAGYSPPAASTNQSEGEAAPRPEQLLRAARAGDLPEVRRLLATQPIDFTDEFGRTPVMLAIEAEKPVVARELVDRGASLTKSDRNGDTPLLLAARSGDKVLLSLLISRGAPVDAANRSGTTPLMLAAGAGSRELCDQLLVAGASRDLLDTAGLRAGDYAARAGHSDLARQLGVEAKRAATGPSRVAALNAGQTALMIAAESGDIASLGKRLAAGDNKNAIDAQGMTALALAARAGKVAVVEALLTAGARVDVRDRAGSTALGHALRAGQVDVARRLLRGGADPATRQANGKSVLLLAIESGSADAIRGLVDAGADANAGDDSGMTPLMAAGSANSTDAVKALLAVGARPEATDRHKRTALWYAASQGASGAVSILAVKSALNAIDDEGNTPLAIAVGRGHRPVVEALLKAGADARIRTRNENSVLHLAAASSEAALIPLLIAARAPVDGVNTHGDTALMLGVKSHCLACAKSLLSASASTRVRNGDGLTAKDIARLSTDQALIQLLD